MSEWIPVNIRLPEQHRVYDDPLNPDGYYMNSEMVLITDGKKISIGTRYENGWDDIADFLPSSDSHLSWENIPVTHWMPLPKLPKEDE